MNANILKNIYYTSPNIDELIAMIQKIDHPSINISEKSIF